MAMKKKYHKRTLRSFAGLYPIGSIYLWAIHKLLEGVVAMKKEFLPRIAGGCSVVNRPVRNICRTDGTAPRPGTAKISSSAVIHRQRPTSGGYY